MRGPMIAQTVYRMSRPETELVGVLDLSLNTQNRPGLRTSCLIPVFGKYIDVV